MFCQLSVIARGLLTALPRPVAGFQGPISKGREGRKDGRRGEGGEGWEEGRQGKTSEGERRGRITYRRDGGKGGWGRGREGKRWEGKRTSEHSPSTKFATTPLVKYKVFRPS